MFEVIWLSEWHNHESLSHQGMYRAVSADENEKKLNLTNITRCHCYPMYAHYCRVEATWVGGEGMA